jgi:lipoyl(octanoyl) transferase
MSAFDLRWLGTVEYRPTWVLQKELAQKRKLGEIGDTLLLLEHAPVYTLGRDTKRDHLGAGPEYLRGLGADVVEVDRGGSITFHGPGQLVAYPILDLATLVPQSSDPTRGDVLRYLRILEEALIATIATCGLEACRKPPHTGAWMDKGKLAAIGVKLASGGVTMHGVALNNTTDLEWFGHIVPCGIRGEGVASIESAGGSCPTVPELGTRFAQALQNALTLAPV